MGEVRNAAWYDARFNDPKSRYRLEPEALQYHGLWQLVVDRIRDGDVVVDLGCGAGHLAQMTTRAKDVRYRGYDFSEAALALARKRAPTAAFFRWDASREPVPHPTRLPTTYVSTEFMEHVADDLGVLRQIPAGASVIITVPSRDDPGHVRFFATLKEAKARYAQVLDLTDALRHEVPAWRKDAAWYLLAGTRRT